MVAERGYMKPEEYERLVASLAKSVADRIEKLPEAAIGCGKQNRWIGASGFRHQIDVSIMGQERVLLVECKYWKRRVPVEAVLALQGRLDDIRPTLATQLDGAIVSRVGFQSGAQQMGGHFGIHCDVVKSTQEFGFKYHGHLVIQPRSASASLSTSIGAVVIEKKQG
jgi:hypothetical protein